MGVLQYEHILESMIVRKRENVVPNKAAFTGVAGSYDEESQRRAAQHLRLIVIGIADGWISEHALKILPHLRIP